MLTDATPSDPVIAWGALRVAAGSSVVKFTVWPGSAAPVWALVRVALRLRLLPTAGVVVDDTSASASLGGSTKVTVNWVQAIPEYATSVRWRYPVMVKVAVPV